MSPHSPNLNEGEEAGLFSLVFGEMANFILVSSKGAIWFWFLGAQNPASFRSLNNPSVLLHHSYQPHSQERCACGTANGLTNISFVFSRKKKKKEAKQVAMVCVCLCVWMIVASPRRVGHGVLC